MSINGVGFYFFMYRWSYLHALHQHHSSPRYPSARAAAPPPRQFAAAGAEASCAPPKTRSARVPVPLRPVWCCCPSLSIQDTFIKNCTTVKAMIRCNSTATALYLVCGIICVAYSDATLKIHCHARDRKRGHPWNEEFVTPVGEHYT